MLRRLMLTRRVRIFATHSPSCTLGSQHAYRLLSTSIAVFLEKLQSYPALPSSHVTYLGKLYGLSSTPNAELRWRFYEVALLDPASPAAREYAPAAAQWVTGHDGTHIVRGRMKFCRPTFRAIARADRKLALEYYGENKLSFHPIARRLIEKDLGIAA